AGQLNRARRKIRPGALEPRAEYVRAPVEQAGWRRKREAVQPVVSQVGAHVGTGKVRQDGSEQGSVVVEGHRDRRVEPVAVGSPTRESGATGNVQRSRIVGRQSDRRRGGAGARRVRPFVLIAIAAGTEERRRRPVALVVGLLPARVVPGIEQWVGYGLARLVGDEVLLILFRRPARDLATAAARIRLDRVLHHVGAAREIAVIRTERKGRS